MIAVDLGCFDYDHRYRSMQVLVQKYKPDMIYGFDPRPTMGDSISVIDGCPAEVQNRAAWLYDGEARYCDRAEGSFLADSCDQTVQCFDFSSWLSQLPGKVVVKMDIEGGEYELLDKMIEDGTAGKVKELLVEWHGIDPNRRNPILERWPGKVREWWL